MKRVCLLITCLCLADLLTQAQQPEASTLATAPMATSLGQQLNGSAPDDYVPLNNTPFFPGGRQALEAYFLNPALYPYIAQKQAIEGTVQVHFRVQPSGFLTNIRVVESQGPLLDQAALRAVAQMPRWYPAHQVGTAVVCPMSLAIRFEFF